MNGTQKKARGDCGNVRFKLCWSQWDIIELSGDGSGLGRTSCVGPCAVPIRYTNKEQDSYFYELFDSLGGGEE